MCDNYSRLSTRRIGYELSCKQTRVEETLQRAPLHVHLVHIRLDAGKSLKFQASTHASKLSFASYFLRFLFCDLFASARGLAVKASRNERSDVWMRTASYQKLIKFTAERRIDRRLEGRATIIPAKSSCARPTVLTGLCKFRTIPKYRMVNRIRMFWVRFPMWIKKKKYIYVYVHLRSIRVSGVENNHLCKDKIANCNLVTQARLCSYPFYQQSCCLSCSRAKQDLE